MIDMMLCILFPDHFPNLDQGCQSKYSTNHPVQDILVVVDLIGDQLASENKYTVADQGSYADSNNIGVVMTCFRQQYFFREQNRTPSKPERDLDGIDSAHHQSKQVPV